MKLMDVQVNTTKHLATANDSYAIIAGKVIIYNSELSGSHIPSKALDVKTGGARTFIPPSTVGQLTAVPSVLVGNRLDPEQ
jgi:hypothetical protein